MIHQEQRPDGQVAFFCKDNVVKESHVRMSRQRYSIVIFMLIFLLLPTAALAASDLVVSSFALNPASPAAATAFKIEVVIENKGADRAGSRFSTCSFEIYAYADGKKIGSKCDAFGLAGKSKDNYTINIPATAIATNGLKRVELFVDATAKVSESNENNNKVSRSVNFTRQGADLVVSRIWVSPSTPITKQATTVYVEVQNAGSTDVTSSFSVSVQVGTGSPVQLSVPSLASGAKRVLFTQTTQTTAGKKTITAKADSKTQIPELDDNNNSKSASFTWKDNLPDLEITKIAFSPTSPAAGATAKMTVTVKNNGVKSAGGLTNQFILRYSVDGKVSTDTKSFVFGLGAGSTGDKTFNVSIPTQGAHQIKVDVDPTNKIKETDENNNSKTATWTWSAALPDLDPISLVVNPGSPIVGSPSTFRVGIKNIGPSNASGSILVDFYLDGQKLGSKPFTNLSAGSVKFVDYSYTVTSTGAHKIKAVVNPSGSTPKELSTSNNTIEKSFTWGSVPRADLIVQSISVLPSPPQVQQSVKITATVKNQGSKGAPIGVPSFLVRFYVDGKQIGDSSQFTGLSAGSTTSFNKTITVNTPGPHTIRVEVDPTDKIVESDEKNNTKDLAVTWKDIPRPDLTVSSIVTTPTTVTTGSTASIGIAIRNLGITTTDNITVRLTIDGNQIKPDLTITGGLQEKKLKGLSYKYTATKAGAILVRVEVDPDKKITEADETNNTKEYTINVTQPTVDQDKDGVPASKDCDDNDKNVFPAYNGKPASPEICDGKDNNCDGTRDEGFDEDGDGVTICAADPDCDDKNKDVYPGAAELCNNKDDDCDGKVDEELKRSCQSACGNGNEVCVDGKWSSCDAPAPKTEECNGQDDDCNGVPDDGDLCQTGESCQAGVCVKVSPCSPACKDTETCVEGQCVPKDPCAGVSCSATQECVDGKCVDKPQEEKVTQVEAPANEPTETEQTTGNDAGNTTPDNGNTTPDNGNTTPDNGTTTPDNGTTTPDNGVAPSGGCGCQSQSNSPFSWLALLMLLGLFFQALRIRRTS
ncbi:MAG: hypothetical protein CL920_29055 [Deltaproteobacteria bacterium]|nr:hypothetical protein [Deltaproteobacteria bacterium]|tara:strand:- start:167 stop:3286 length:3120 start_codon:yes stop_codon:yes gene_type:complete